MKKLRLDKYLADMQAGTRSEVKQMIRKGRVTVNERVVRSPEQKVDPAEDTVALDGVNIGYVTLEYWMLNKPQGVVSATEDRRERTVLSLLPDAARKDLFPVGRLDKDTEGLLLLTNDGPLAHALLSPKRHVDKVYRAVVSGVPGQREQEAFAGGLDIGDETETLPARLEILGVCSLEEGVRETVSPSPDFSAEVRGWRAADEQELPERCSEVEITIREGRYHQIKRMFEAVGMRVLFLKRMSMGPLHLDPDLEPGQARRLTEGEIAALRKAEHR